MPPKEANLSFAIDDVGQGGQLINEAYVTHAPRRQDRPSSAIPVSRRNHAPQPRRPKSAHARSGCQHVPTQAPLQQPVQDRPPYSWLCGNVHGTGHMLGSVVPYPGPAATDEQNAAHLYHIPPRQPCRAPFRPQRTPGATTSTLLRSSLNVQVLDRITDLPIPGATVLVVDARSFVEERSNSNVGSTATRNTKADSRGRVRCTVLAGHRCVYGQVLSTKRNTKLWGSPST